MKKVTFIALIFLYTSAQAQNPSTGKGEQKEHNDTEDSTRLAGHVYHVNLWGSIAITVGSELFILGVRSLPNHTAPDITNQEFDLAQSETGRAQINFIDAISLRIPRRSTDYSFPSADLQVACAAAPLLLLFGDRFRKNWDDIILLMAEVNAINMLTFTIAPFSPYFQRRLRPIVYQATTPEVRDQQKTGSNRASFYSGHTSAAAASMFLMAKIYCDYNPQIQGWEKVGIYALASVPVLAMGYLRIIGLRHFPSDVITGALVGGTIGIVVPEMHRILGKDATLGAYSSPESTGLKLAWNIY